MDPTVWKHRSNFSRCLLCPGPGDLTVPAPVSPVEPTLAPSLSLLSPFWDLADAVSKAEGLLPASCPLRPVEKARPSLCSAATFLEKSSPAPPRMLSQRKDQIVWHPVSNITSLMNFCPPHLKVKASCRQGLCLLLGPCCLQVPCRNSGFSGGASGKKPACQCRKCKRHGFEPWAGKIPRSRKWQLAPVFLAGKFQGQKSLAGSSPWNRRVRRDWVTEHTKELDGHLLSEWMKTLC